MTAGHAIYSMWRGDRRRDKLSNSPAKEARRGGWSSKLIPSGTFSVLTVDQRGRSVSCIVVVVNWGIIHRRRRFSSALKVKQRNGGQTSVRAWVSNPGTVHQKNPAVSNPRGYRSANDDWLKVNQRHIIMLQPSSHCGANQPALLHDCIS